ncbi:hypothetical protein ABEW34_06325 [Paenibacillus algorifonticola]|uniref:hypothetical protein n=1 Tax=Paenibacillus algorifonticola TaxID=684063 RepID=UPI003D2B183E
MNDTYGYTNGQVQIYIPPSPSSRAGQDCGCGGPRMLMPGGPGLFPPGPGPGPFPPGPGPFPPGPGPFPPGPGPFPPGPGPFPPGPGPFPPGPGPFPPGPGPFPPGPGPFPPGPGPFPPGPGPFPPFPFPIPLPIPIPFPPGPQGTVTVVINGGRAFPNVTQAYRVIHRIGMTIYQALLETGVVRFGFNGQITSISGIPIGGNISYLLRLNGRVIPSTLLSFPLQRNDAVALELIYSPSGRQSDEDLADISDVTQQS